MNGRRRLLRRLKSYRRSAINSAHLSAGLTKLHAYFIQPTLFSVLPQRVWECSSTSSVEQRGNPPSTMMAGRSPALNPASVPFFPSGISIGPMDGVDRQLVNGGGGRMSFALPNPVHEQESSFTSSASAASADYRSANSSPARGSAPSSASVASGGGDGDGTRADSRASLFPPIQAGLSGGEIVNVDGGFFSTEHRREDEINITGKPANTLDGEETPGPREIHQWVLGARAPGRNDTSHEAAEITSAMNSIFQEHAPVHPGPPTRSFTNTTTHSFNLPFKSSSPVSSIGSASINTSSIDYSSISFEAQIKSSPTIRDLLDRLIRCELSNKEIQRQLSEVHGKINFLVERSLNSIQEPEFKNPFAPPSSASRSLTPSGSLGPNHLASPLSTSPAKSEEISQLSHRINTLTTSVGQLLALQTQQHMNSVAQAFSHGPGQVTPQQPLEIAPNQIIPQAGPVSSTALLGHGLPNRPDLRPNARTPNPPMRTWSAGALELPMRPADNGLGRPDGVLRDKRRSVAGLMRRDSAGVREFIDNNLDMYSHVLNIRCLILPANIGQMVPPVNQVRWPLNGSTFRSLPSCCVR